MVFAPSQEQIAVLKSDAVHQQLLICSYATVAISYLALNNQGKASDEPTLRQRQSNKSPRALRLRSNGPQLTAVSRHTFIACSGGETCRTDCLLSTAPEAAARGGSSGVSGLGSRGLPCSAHGLV